MKKILLIIAVVLCIAIAGTVLAVEYNSAGTITGTMSADSYLKLGLDNCSTAPITVSPDKPKIYTIEFDVTSIQENELTPATGTLTITLTDTGVVDEGTENERTMTLNNVTVALFTDEFCSTPLKLDADNKVDAEGTAVSITGAATPIVINGITASDIYYAKISVPADLSEAACNLCSGSMTLTFNKTV